MNEKVFKESPDGKILEQEIGEEKLYLASEDTVSPNILSMVELLFWSHGFKEHAEVMELLLPKDDKSLNKYRESASKHVKEFDEIHDKIKKLEIDDEQGINKMAVELAKHIKMVDDDLNDMVERQAAGEIKTLMWPSFMEHLIQEGEYFLDRKEEIIDRNLTFDSNDIIDFWSDIMSDHNVFVANLLDPYEVELAEESLELGSNFVVMDEEAEKDIDTVLGSVEKLIKFKKELHEGVENAEVSSIILPELTVHLLGEALMFQSMLKRAKLLGT